MRAKTFIRTAIAIPACAAILVGTIVAPEFAYCDKFPGDLDPQHPYVLADGPCIRSAAEYGFTWSILLLAIASVAVIVSRSANSRRILAGSLASASSTVLAFMIIPILFFGMPLKSLLTTELLVPCVISAAIGAAASWAANKWWPIEHGA